MSEWETVEGTGWIALPGFGRVTPTQDNVDGGRQYFTAMTDDDKYAQAVGDSITGGPQTWYFEFDEPIWLMDGDRSWETVIAPREGGRFGVRYREGSPPQQAAGGWLHD